MSSSPEYNPQLSNPEVKALYGLFSPDMAPLDTVDVTREIQTYLQGNILKLPKDFQFPYHQDHYKRCFLRISANGRIWFIAQDSYHESIEIDLMDTTRRLIIVYYLYTNPDTNWRGIILGQLLQLKSYGILPDAELYVHVTDCYRLAAEVLAIIKAVTPQAIISTSTNNQFEYPGIKLVHQLALQHQESTFLYFHSKGMSRGLHTREPEDVALLEFTFESWRKHLQLLNKSGIEKLGMFPAKGDGAPSPKEGRSGGWIWYNFWIATGQYLAGCPKPEITPDRYYYEEWLGMRKGDQKAFIRQDCASLYRIKHISKTYFSSTEATWHLNRMLHKMALNSVARQYPLAIRSSFALQLLVKWKLLLNSILGIAVR